MIEYIKLLRNIGTFNSDSAAASLSFKRLTLIYADNGRGKTTLAAVLRSLGTGNPDPILDRRRLGSGDPPHVILKSHDPSSVLIFQDDDWNETLSALKIFDDVFVDDNVCSGLEVESQHRQNLHELIIGDQGVALSRRHQALVSRVSEHSAALKEKARAIPQQVRRGLSVDDFCALSELADLGNRIEAANRKVQAANDIEAVQTAPLFKTIELPEFDIDSIKRILLTDLPNLDKAAEAQVHTHLQTIGEGGESWVADGFRRRVASDDGICPFCGQNLDGLELIAHFRAYFSQSYEQLKRDVADMIGAMDRIHADGAQAAFERAVATARQTGQFWEAYSSDIPRIDIDTAVIASDWKAARDSIAELLQAKQAAPLERLTLDDHDLKALNSYHSHLQGIRMLNEELSTANERIRDVQRQAGATDKEEILVELAKLNATQSRFSEEVALLCEDYIQEKEAKGDAEMERNEVRNELNQYRENVFPKLQNGVNKYLQQFNAGYRIGSLTPVNLGRGSGSTCTYNVVINDSPIAVRKSKIPPGEPSFRNSLSAGDRNALALALFLSSLDQDPNLANTVVVIDDPISSMDDHRSLTTVQAVRNLAKRARQVIVLSHNKRFLCNIWNGADRRECLSLEIGRIGDESTIREWDVKQDSVTEHDQRHKLLQEYTVNQSGNKREVAAAIRPHLEGFLRVACPDCFPPGKLLGPFIGDCRNKDGRPDEILSADTILELNHIVEYGNRFHHDTNQAWQTEEINSTELQGYVKRTLAFVGPPRV